MAHVVKLVTMNGGQVSRFLPVTQSLSKESLMPPDVCRHARAEAFTSLLAVVNRCGVHIASDQQNQKPHLQKRPVPQQQSHRRKKVGMRRHHFLTGCKCCSQDGTNRDQEIIETKEHRDQDKTKAVYISKKNNNRAEQITRIFIKILGVFFFYMKGTTFFFSKV